VPAEAERPRWQARVRRSPEGLPAGGVLCAGNWVLTCAHVVADGPDAPDLVWVEFPFAGLGQIAARVAPDGWRPATADGFADLALLELVDDVPDGVQPAPLRVPGAQAGHRFRALGFPRGHDDGVLVRGEVEGSAHREWTQLVSEAGRGHLIDRGFSGSPVWDEQIMAVTGIVVARDRDPAVRGGYAIGLDIAVRYLPQLRPWASWRVSTDTDFAGHWDVRARGVDRWTRLGSYSYFTGRRKAREQLAEWAGDPARSGIRVVTGGPGSGKSALIAHLLMLSDPWMRAHLADTGQAAEEAATVPPGWASAGVRATGLDRAGVAARLAAALPIPVTDPDDLVAALAGRGDNAPVAVVVDALDEAVSPIEADRIARMLLLPLAAEASVSVLVGTRGAGLDALGSRAVVIDLDSPDYFDLDDLVNYAAASLRLDHDPAATSSYRDDPATTAAVAAAIAAAAAPSFLVAGLAARARAEDPAVIDTASPGWSSVQRFPAAVDAAMRDYLERVPNQELLVPLAFAQPPGLPRDTLWPAFAAAYCGRPVGIAELDALLRSPAAYLIETTAGDGEPAARLFHQALTDFIRGQTREPAVEAAFTDVMTTRVAQAGGWARADDYTRAHLATHAAAAGHLDQLVTDPGFLLAAEPKSLMSAFRTLTSEHGRLAGKAYRFAHPRLEITGGGDRRSYLELGARRAGAVALAGRIAELPGTVAWEPTWATERRLHTILTFHEDLAFALAVGTVGGETVALSGGPDGFVRATELATSTPLGAVMTDLGAAVIARPGQAVGAVALCHVHGVPWAVASFADGLVCAAGLPFGSEEVEVVPAHWHEPREQWTLLASADRFPFLAICEMDEVIHILDAEAGHEVAQPLHPGGVTRLAAGVLDGSPVLVSGGFDGTVRLWDFATGHQRGTTLSAGSGQVHTLATTVLNGRLVIIASVLVDTNEEGYGTPGALLAWDAASGRPVLNPSYASLSPLRLGAATVGGQPVLALASHSRLSLIDGRTGDAVVPDFFTAGYGRVIALAAADVDGRVAVVAAQEGGVVELIFADEVAGADDPADPLSGSIEGARFAASARVIAGGLDHDRLRLWDPATGTQLRVPGRNTAVSSFDIAQAGERMVAVAGTREPDRITAWDADSGELLADLDATDAGRQFAMTHTAGRTIIVGVGWEHLRVWDVATGQPLWQAALPQHNTTYVTAPRPLIHSGHGSPAVLWWDSSNARAWDLFTGERLAPPPRRKELSAAAMATVGGQDIGLLGTEKGLVLTWDLRTGNQLHAPLKCGAGVFTLTIRTAANETTLLAGGDGLYEWDLATGQLVSAAYEGQWVSAIADIAVAQEKLLCVGFNSGRVVVPTHDLTLELDEPITNIWGFSGDRILVATTQGLVAIRVGVG
jgi:WD40 repeat protein